MLNHKLMMRQKYKFMFEEFGENIKDENERNKTSRNKTRTFLIVKTNKKTYVLDQIHLHSCHLRGSS
jgi:hypothetical protein